jgi:hypothetical protein
MKVDEYIQYWIDSPDDDFQAMIHLSEKENFIKNIPIILLKHGLTILKD